MRECNPFDNKMIKRPGVEGAVLQSASWLSFNLLIEWLILWLKYHLTTFNPKPEELGSWNFERMFIQHYVSCAMCHMSGVTCFCICKTAFIQILTFQTYFFITRKWRWHNYLRQIWTWSKNCTIGEGLGITRDI